MKRMNAGDSWLSQTSERGGLAEVRQVTDRNARGVQQTRTNTADLLRQAEALNAMVERDAAGSSRSNGRSGGANGH